MVTTRTCEVVATGAVGVLLGEQEDRLQLVATSDGRPALVELFEVQAVEGPCRDCVRLRGPVDDPDLRHATARWPRFAPLAVSAGFVSVHAFPLRLRTRVIGVLDVLRDVSGRMPSSEARVVQALADVVTIGILQQRARRRSEELSAQLQRALDSRIVVEQAKGALAQLRGCTPDEAFEVLRDLARSNRLRLTDVASTLMAHPERMRDLGER